MDKRLRTSAGKGRTNTGPDLGSAGRLDARTAVVGRSVVEEDRDVRRLRAPVVRRCSSKRMTTRHNNNSATEQ
jgi:hypothetical protein